jgi:chaperonin GroES
MRLLWLAMVAIESTLAFTVLLRTTHTRHAHHRAKLSFGRRNNSIIYSEIDALPRRSFRCDKNERKSLTLAISSSTSTDSDSATTTTLDGRKILGDIVPLNNFILVRTAEDVAETTGGILLTGKAKQKKTEGSVVAVGPGRTHPDSGLVFAMPVQVGDNVVYGQFDGTEIDIGGVPHTLIRDDDVLVTFPAHTELTLETVQVVRDTVLVSIERKEMETEGGILIAKSSKTATKPSTGRVVAVGPGKMAANGTLMAMEVKVGDNVKFRDFAGNEVDISGQEYSVVKMTDILAKF